MNTKGTLIALEGIDNSGKTTQVTRIAEYYSKQGLGVTSTKELTSPIGSFIREELYSHRLSPLLKTLLFATDRGIRYERIVLPALKRGFLVLADRWKLSAKVYRAAEGFDKDFVEQVNSKTPEADLTFLLDVPVEVAVQRGEKADRLAPYSMQQLICVRNMYLEYAEESNIRLIDAVKTPNLVFKSIVGILSAECCLKKG